VRPSQLVYCASRPHADESLASRPTRLRLEQHAARASHSGAGGGSLPGAGLWLPGVAGGVAVDAQN
jgi:hypothetical protein